VYDSHELWPDRNGRWESRPWLIASEALFTRAADRVVVTSPGHGRALAARHRTAEPLLVRNIPVSVSVSAAPTEPLDPPVIAYVGGLMPGRGLEEMIDALPLLDGVRLRIVGPGAPAYREALRERARRLGVAGAVELAGAVPPDAVGAALAGTVAGLCLIRPVCRSYELCLPNKLFEYVAASLPIIAGDTPVIAEVVHGGGLGEVVDGDSPEALAAAVRRLLEPARRARAVDAVRAFAAANPPAAEGARLAALYGELLSVTT
jgi:glycosyltransferase involved in cell wall biosynthesis